MTFKGPFQPKAFCDAVIHPFLGIKPVVLEKRLHIRSGTIFMLEITILCLWKFLQR